MQQYTKTLSVRVNGVQYDARFPEQKGIQRRAFEDLTALFSDLWGTLTARQQAEMEQKHALAIKLLEVLP